MTLADLADYWWLLPLLLMLLCCFRGCGACGATRDERYRRHDNTPRIR